jgi:hypothetical protein
LSGGDDYSLLRCITQEGDTVPRKVMLVVILAFLLSGCSAAALQPYIAPPPQERGQPPVIVDAYAAKVIRPGDTWMIFLRAEDPDGNMTSISAGLWQAGVGYYPTEVTMLKPDESKELVGYLYLRTPPSFNINWDEFELTLSIWDSNGNRSQSVKFPLTFDMGAPRQQIPGKWQEAAKHLITPLMFHIESSWFYNRGGNDGDRL